MWTYSYCSSWDNSGHNPAMLRWTRHDKGGFFRSIHFWKLTTKMENCSWIIKINHWIETITKLSMTVKAEPDLRQQATSAVVGLQSEKERSTPAAPAVQTHQNPPQKPLFPVIKSLLHLASEAWERRKWGKRENHRRREMRELATSATGWGAIWRRRWRLLN